MRELLWLCKRAMDGDSPNDRRIEENKSKEKKKPATENGHNWAERASPGDALNTRYFLVFFDLLSRLYLYIHAPFNIFTNKCASMMQVSPGQAETVAFVAKQRRRLGSR